jgi:hypothetical protein
LADNPGATLFAVAVAFADIHPVNSMSGTALIQEEHSTVGPNRLDLDVFMAKAC